MDYDRSLRTEKIYDDHRKFLLKIVYDASGHPTLWVPSSKLMSVNLTYSSAGQVTSIQRGPTVERVEYDSQGRIVSRTFADGKTWSYTYLDKVRIVNFECAEYVALMSEISKEYFCKGVQIVWIQIFYRYKLIDSFWKLLNSLCQT